MCSWECVLVRFRQAVWGKFAVCFIFSIIIKQKKKVKVEWPTLKTLDCVSPFVCIRKYFETSDPFHWPLWYALPHAVRSELDLHLMDIENGRKAEKLLEATCMEPIWRRRRFIGRKLHQKLIWRYRRYFFGLKVQIYWSAHLCGFPWICITALESMRVVFLWMCLWTEHFESCERDELLVNCAHKL